jgi:hypothetical protein
LLVRHTYCIHIVLRLEDNVGTMYQSFVNLDGVLWVRRDVADEVGQAVYPLPC